MAVKAIRLETGNGLSATFVPEAGMIGVSLRSEGEELLGQRRGLESYVDSGKTMGMPILYPWANRLSADRYEFEGLAVELGEAAYGVRRDGNGLPIHGTLAASPFWEIEHAAAGGDLERAVLRATLDFGAHPELLETFPFPHRLELEVTLEANTLAVTTTVTPTGTQRVPLAYGFHPYLTLPDTERGAWTVDLPAMTALANDERGIPNGQSSDFPAVTKTLGDEAWDRGFSGLKPGASFSVSDGGRTLSLRLDHGYAAAQIFAPPTENVICFEPMKAPTDALISGTGLSSVGPGETDVSRFTITVDTAAGPAAVPDAASGFRLDPAAPAGEIRRVAHERVQSALHALRETEPEGREAAIHDARKDIKKVRAALRLIRGDLGKSNFRAENRRFRDAARQLSQTRDLDVLIGTVERLGKSHPGDSAALEELLDDLQDRRDLELESGGHAQTSLADAADAIEAGGRQIDRWNLPNSDWQLFERGLERTYRDGRRALKLAVRESTAPAIHEWRKRVKDLWYQLRLLRSAWDEGLKSSVKETGRLADLLGEYNDLALLDRELESRKTGKSDLTGLIDLASDRQAEILDIALPLGRRIYAEDPAAFVTRIGRYWQA